MANTRYGEEACKTLIRAMVGLFAALVGFGLNELLGSDSPEIQAERVACFSVLLLMALRIVCGSCIHLTDVHLRRVPLDADPPETSGAKATASSDPARRASLRALVDILTLMVFGVLLTHAAHATSLTWYFVSLSMASAAMVFWAWFDYYDGEEHELLFPYLMLNTGSVLIYGALAFAASQDGLPPLVPGHIGWLGVVALGWALLVATYDIRCQLFYLFNGLSMSSSKPPLLVGLGRTKI